MVHALMSRISFIDCKFLSGGSNGVCSCRISILNGRYNAISCVYEGRLVVSCDYGYETTTKYPNCNPSGHWIPTPSCEPKACNDPIPNGYLSETCTFGSSCHYNCNYLNGYRPAQTNVTCDASTHWTVNPDSLCVKDRPPPVHVPCPPIENAQLSPTCSRSQGSTCTFRCNLDCYSGETTGGSIYCQSSSRYSSWRLVDGSYIGSCECSVLSKTAAVLGAFSGIVFLGCCVGCYCHRTRQKRAKSVSTSPNSIESTSPNNVDKTNESSDIKMV